MSKTSSWPSRLVVTRNPIDLFNRSYCPVVIDSPHRTHLRSRDSSLIKQIFNLSQVYAPNCSNIQCHIIQSNYSGAICLKTGQTYTNLCEILFALCTKQLDPYQVHIDYFGACVSHCSSVKRCFSDRQICVMTPKPHCIARQRNCTGYAPVCDIYGKTFVNRCHLSNSLVFNQPRQLAYRGPCRLNRECTNNLCQSHEICVQTQDKYHYPACLDCRSTRVMFSCPFELFCGDNRRQYVNRCQLHYERCQTRTLIRIDYLGACRSNDKHNNDDDDDDEH
jgi:hypothetical protein